MSQSSYLLFLPVFTNYLSLLISCQSSVLSLIILSTFWLIPFSFYLLVILLLYNLNTFCVVILNLYTLLLNYLITFLPSFLPFLSKFSYSPLSSDASRYPCFDDAKVRLFGHTNKFFRLFYRLFAIKLTYIKEFVRVHTQI